MRPIQSLQAVGASQLVARKLSNIYHDYSNGRSLTITNYTGGNFVAENGAEKATLFADHLATQCVPPACIVAGEVLCDLHLADVEEQFKLLIIVEIVETINEFTKTKGVWPRRYHLRKVKAITNSGGRTPIVPHQLYDGSQHLPIALEEATVVMLPRHYNRPTSTPRKYRPINLLSAVAKVVEAVILHRLKALVDASHFGYRQGYSTTPQLLCLTEWTTRAFNLKKITGV
ncbi:hypothetical protein Zmor_004129 [Zophobas morio]|jgi:hypothetical protein|uniref:Reverse transcriptase domain-containing protein n=1 Tax=Zophobas morio TaxID=2755281 RepID=A0AA38HKU2_9CUCU|nr:hypothetical protein Zmor_004129 [Zophobas morio]